MRQLSALAFRALGFVWLSAAPLAAQDKPPGGLLGAPWPQGSDPRLLSAPSFDVRPLIRNPEDMAGRAGCVFHEHPNYGGQSHRVVVGWAAIQEPRNIQYAQAVNNLGDWWSGGPASVDCDRTETYWCVADLYDRPDLGGRRQTIQPERDGVSAEEAARLSAAEIAANRNAGDGGFRFSTVPPVGSGPRNVGVLGGRVASLAVICHWAFPSVVR